MLDKYPFTPITMRHPYSSFVPYLDPNTMYFHYDVIYKNAVETLNQLIAANPQYGSWTLQDLILKDIRQVPAVTAQKMKFYAGSVYNHGLFFEGLDPSRATLPHGNLLKAINANYGNYENFKNLFVDAAKSDMGSGWVWLNSEGGGKLHIATTGNCSSPAIDKLMPVMALDVWEHAYYLKYPVQVDRFARNWFEVVDWGKAEARFNQKK